MADLPTPTTRRSRERSLRPIEDLCRSHGLVLVACLPHACGGHPLRQSLGSWRPELQPADSGNDSLGHCSTKRRSSAATARSGANISSGRRRCVPEARRVHGHHAARRRGVQFRQRAPLRRARGRQSNSDLHAQVPPAPVTLNEASGKMANQYLFVRRRAGF